MCLDDLKINNYIDGILSKEENYLIEEHLLSCNKCQSLVNSYKLAIKTVKILPNKEVPLDFIDNLFTRIELIDIHPTFQEISSYFDESTTSEKHYQIKEHIDSCSKCSEILNNISVTSKSVASLESYQLNDNFLDNLLSNIENLEAKETVFHLSNEDLSAYLDKEKTSISTELIEKHLEECDVCKNKYENLKLTRKTTLNLEKPTAIFDFSDKVLSAIIQEEKQENKILQFTPRKNKIYKVSMIAGIVIVGIVVLVSNPFKDSTNAPVQTATTKIDVLSEDYLFTKNENKTDSFDILLESQDDTSLLVEDIGL